MEATSTATIVTTIIQVGGTFRGAIRGIAIAFITIVVLVVIAIVPDAEWAI
jgi:hypothetical protein